MSSRRIFAVLFVLSMLLFVSCSNGKDILELTDDSVTNESSVGEGALDEYLILDDDSYFEAHFIDVGQADASLIICDGCAMLIDGGNKADSSLIYSYLKKQEINHLDYIVCTHAHEDHVGGLAGALNYASVDKAYCSVSSYDSEAFSNFVSYLEKQGVSITIPMPGDSFTLGSAEVTIIGPVNATTDLNATSIVLRIVYGETSFLFTGDATFEEENDILESDAVVNSTLLKVGHHGSEYSTGYLWLREIMPEYAVISVGEDNSYGHPTDTVLSKLRDADVTTFRTDLQGDIVAISDGKNVTVTVSKNAGADTLALRVDGYETAYVEVVTDVETDIGEDTVSGNEQKDEKYILNTSSKKIHREDCTYAQNIKEENRAESYNTKEELIAQGYTPCKSCKP